MKKQGATSKTRGRKQQVFPRGWNQKRVQEVIAYYDRQTEEEEAAEYEAAMKVEGLTVMFVPTEFVPQIRRLIRGRRDARSRRDGSDK
jgi:hypothetical protein